jgi:hypothetical protein
MGSSVTLTLTMSRRANLQGGCKSKFANVLQRLRILTAGMADTRRLHDKGRNSFRGHEPSNCPVAATRVLQPWARRPSQ